MSLLLDALKEADSRRGQQADGRSAPRAAARAPAVGASQTLSILEDPVPGQPPAARSPAALPDQAPSRAHGMDERVARRHDNRGHHGRPKHLPRSLVLPALLVLTIAGLGAAYLFLADPGEAPVLASRTLPSALPVTEVPAEATHVLPEPQLEVAAPRSALVPVVSAPVVAAPVVPVPVAPAVEPAAQPPAQPERGASRIERSTRSPPLLEAYAAFRAGDLALAESRYREVLRAEPHQADAHLGLAVLAQARGDRGTALSHFRSVLEITPDHPRAWSGVADLAGPGDVEAMESRLRGLIAGKPAASLHFALGNVLARQSRWAEAQESYYSAMATGEANADYAFNLAVSLDHLGKRAAAVSFYDQALELAGNGMPVQFKLESARSRLAALRETVP